MSKRWKTVEAAPVEALQALGSLYAEAPLYAPVFSQLLWNRGLKTRQDAERFLSPNWISHVHDAKQFRHMDGAIAKVFAAFEKGERITVHGDYDADGVTGSTVLITTLREIESKLFPGRETLVDSYIPHRDREGYGLRKETVPKLTERGTKLIITVDCGIACVEEIALAK